MHFRRMYGLLSYQSLISQMTEISRNHLTPEMKLHLITPSCSLWVDRAENSPFSDPFWAFYWPGGQALSRYVLDNGKLFKGQSVLDIGSGSGACAIAAALVKATKVIANDIDPVACEVIKMNAELNKVTIEVNQENILDSNLKANFIFVGDMFYDPDFSCELLEWLSKCMSHGSKVLIGDPGRYSLSQIKNKYSLIKLVEYNLHYETIVENNGFSTASVWRLN